jgi:hypothetical protein
MQGGRMSKSWSLLIAAGGTAILTILLKFGTINPCGIVRAQVRAESALAAALPDGIIDAIIVAQHGALSPGRCIEIAFGGGVRNAPTQSQAAAPAAPLRAKTEFTVPQGNAAALRRAGEETDAAITACRNKRLSGELKTHVESAECANPFIVEAHKKAGYRYMDLVLLMTAKRLELSEKVDQGKLSEAQAQLELAQFMTGISDEERQRDSGRK